MDHASQTFPELKKLHTAYTDEDFEIVGVSIDSTDWKIGKVASTNSNFRGLISVKSKGWEGPSVYHVWSQRDSERISRRFARMYLQEEHSDPAALKDFLVDRYGMDESLVEPEEETEDNARGLQLTTDF